MPQFYHYIVALLAPRSVPQYITWCGAVITKMSANTLFASPPLAYSQVQADLDALQIAEEATRNGAKGTVSDRDVKLRLVHSDMRVLKSFAQRIADASPGSAEAVIEASGFNVSRRRSGAKPDFAGTPGEVPGTIDLQCRAVRRVRAVYYWEMSTDQKTWSPLPDTLLATTSVAGLTAGTTYSFRYRTLTAGGLSAWSAVISVIAH